MRKLLKYEFRALWRIFLPCWAGILLLGLLNSFSVRRMAYSVHGATLGIFALLAYMIAIIAILVVALVFMVSRFYKGLLKDNGYLMFTLPVSTDALIWSKAVSAVLLFMGTMVCCLVSLLLIIRDLPMEELAQLTGAIWNYFNGEGHAILIACLVVGLLIFVAGVFGSIFQIYLSMGIGHLASKGRGVLSILTYIGICIAKSSLSNTVVSRLLMGINENTLQSVSGAVDRYMTMMQGTPQQVSAALGMVLVVLFGVLLLQVIETLVYYFFTRLILKRKLNLE